ncbi:choice-of-anchor L domain-containing protein [Flavobacterium chuncheonense]|uniref:Choice-of-anchor L domain-containing protein n=1 Tax=Flavobacterium chuncheonense TaxID=2026653 RepID=A0ABW5YL87_9FLAO
MQKRLFHFIFVMLLYCNHIKAQYITVGENYTAQELVENVLLNSSCVSVTNITASGGNFASGAKSFGYFDGNGTNFPFQNGIILSTGKINNAPGPNTYISDDGGGMGWSGDNDLDQALNISNSLNATILEFDFVPLGNHIQFDYIFASEEYHGTATCTYSDGFAFLLKEVGATTYQNLALIPNTNIPVKVTTVHPNIPGGCGPQNEQYFDAFNGSNHPTNYNGQTKVLTAQTNVTPGTTYHIKLVIADEGNYRYDSAIFLKGGSFNLGVDLGEDRTFADNNPICYDENFVLDATTTGATSYQWQFNNQDIPGATNPTLLFTPPYTTSQNGNYTVAITLGNCTPAVTSIALEFTEDLGTLTASYTKCDEDAVQDGLTVFTPNDFDTIANQLNIPNNYTLTYFIDSQHTTPIAFPFSNTNAYAQIVYAGILEADCYNFPITLSVNTFDEDYSDAIVKTCNNAPVILTAGNNFTAYSWNTNPVQTTASISVAQPGNYSVTLTNADGCSKVKTFTVISSDAATLQKITINDFSDNNSVTIIATGSGDYEYSLDGVHYQDTPYFDGLNPGSYTAYVKDKNGCGVVESTFYILDYPKFFSPNDDGHHDIWNISNLKKSGLENSKIYIFDRYGKLLKQIGKNESGWDGTFNGTKLPSSDYWFVLELPNGRVIKNHFTLIR